MVLIEFHIEPKGPTSENVLRRRSEFHVVGLPYAKRIPRQTANDSIIIM